MRWSAAFNEFFNQNQSTFDFISKCYPEIQLFFESNPAFIDNEDVLVIVFLCGRAAIQDESHDFDFRVITSFFEFSRLNVSILRHARNILAQLQQFDYLSCAVIERLFTPSLQTVFQSFCEMFLRLSDADLIQKDNVPVVLDTLIDQMPLFIDLLEVLKKCYGAFIYAEIPVSYWQSIFQLSQKDERALVELGNIFENLDRLNVLTQEQIQLHFEAIAKFLQSDADFEDIHQYFVESKRKYVRFELPNLDAKTTENFYQHADKIYELCDCGFSIADLGAHFTQFSKNEQVSLLMSFDKSNINLLSVLSEKNIPASILLSLLVPECLDALSEIQDVIQFGDYNADNIANKLVAQIRQSDDDISTVLSQFLNDLEAFKFLPVTEAVRLNMQNNAQAVALVCRTGLSIEKFARCAYFHSKIFEHINEETAMVLADFFDHVSEAVYVMILVNAIDSLHAIASRLPRAEGEFQAEPLMELISEFIGHFEGRELTPANIIAFFEGYLALMHRPKNPDLKGGGFFGDASLQRACSDDSLCTLSPR